MRGFLWFVAAMGVMALAFWAYRENYATKAALDDLTRVERAIANERAALAVLRAEWAYLNRPDRLRDLADLNFDRLGLLPFRPEQFGRVEEVVYPPPPAPDLALPVDGVTDVLGDLPTEETAP